MSEINKETKPNSRIMQIANFIEFDSRVILVLCENGSMWERKFNVDERSHCWSCILEAGYDKKEPKEKDCLCDLQSCKICWPF